jgi:glycosyltransferase involved in cell wall biosynthesis
MAAQSVISRRIGGIRRVVQKSEKMIRVAFAFPEDPRWTGGVNYLHNLLFALKSVQSEDIEPIIFAGCHVDAKMLERFKGLARIECHTLFDPGSAVWKVRRIIARLTGTDYLVRRLFAAQNIHVASHCTLAGKDHPFKTIAWIPDFQHLHLPDFFPNKERKLRDYKFLKLIKDSDLMVLSSHDAAGDYKEIAPQAIEKVRILHFVSQVDSGIYELDDLSVLCEKYSVPRKFFFLPNQFWSHKNHLTVVRALGLLKARQCDVHVVCSGNPLDLKSADSVHKLQKEIEQSGVSNQFQILGLIDYVDMLTLFRHAVSVINPSFFEGWSSTVEEAKSIGKNVILSDLPVHREQAPTKASYFDPYDHEALAEIMWQKWQSCDGGPDFELEETARKALPDRTRQFGETFRKIIYEAAGK